MHSAIITGANGFIGSHLAKELTSNGVQVYAIVKDSSSNIDNIRNIENVKIIYCNLENIDNLDKRILCQNIDVFYHLAWSGVASHYKNDLELQLNNIRYSIEALKVSKKVNSKLFIGAGTVAEYVFCDKPMNPSYPFSPADLYGAAKASSNLFCNEIAKQIEQNIIWTILPSTFGEGREDKNVLTYTIKSLLENKKPSFTKLEQMWDFLYIRDVVKALYLIGIKGEVGQTYGIGSGVYKPMRYYIETIRDIINVNLPLGIGDIPYASDKIPSSCVDISKLVEDTGFKPEFSFEQGIKKTIQWYKERYI